MTAMLDALRDNDCDAEQRATLFRMASQNWYDMQPIFRRASHLCACLDCGKLYIEHPLDKQWPFLNRLCSGDLVKL